jgi:molybdopterin-guanine dinucleotide biosynthesis protein A
MANDSREASTNAARPIRQDVYVGLSRIDPSWQCVSDCQCWQWCPLTVLSPFLLYTRSQEEDVEALLENIRQRLDYTVTDYKEFVKEVEPFNMGTVIMQKRSDELSDGVHYIVDGQQRLTTLLLILAAIYRMNEEVVVAAAAAAANLSEEAVAASPSTKKSINPSVIRK